MGYEIRPVTDEELADFTRTEYLSFGLQAGDEEIAETRAVAELDRTLAIFDRGRVAASAAALSFQLTLPGLTVGPAAGVTAVGVLPTHRRRGMLTALMARQLDDIAAAGESLAVLGASESTIYGRFGYGPATEAVSVEIDRAHAALADPHPPVGRVELLDPNEMHGRLPAIFERYQRGQPGEVSRTPGFWAAFLRDSELSREGGTARFAVVYQSPSGEAQGYVTYRMKGDPWATLPDRTLQVEELIAVTPAARAALWRYCFAVDLVGTVRASVLPADEPLRWMLADSRRLRTTGLRDFLWVRLVDVAGALAARRYRVSDAMVLDVADAFRPSQAGRFRLEGGPDGAECRRTSDSADLGLDVAALASLYLGGVRATTLARAGRVAELRPGALARADAFLASVAAPYCLTEF